MESCDVKRKIADLVAHYNHTRHHENISNPTTVDVYFTLGQNVQLERERMKRETIKNRRLQHCDKPA